MVLTKRTRIRFSDKHLDLEQPLDQIWMFKREFVVDSSASVYTVSKVDLTREEQHIITMSRNPPTVIRAGGTIRTTEQTTVHVKDLDMFDTVQLPKESPTVLSFGKLYEEHWWFPCGSTTITNVFEEWQHYSLQAGQIRANCRTKSYQRRSYL